MSQPWVAWAMILWLGSMAPAVAGADLSGLEYGRPGAKCQTKEGAFASRTLWDRQRVTSIGGSGDHKAFQQLIDQGIAIELRQLTVFVEDRQGLYVQIRPEGRLELLWVTVLNLQCAKKKAAP